MTLRRGSAGNSVVQLQGRLRDLGHYTGPLDGKFGGGTEIAVRKFQSAEGSLSWNTSSHTFRCCSSI